MDRGEGDEMNFDEMRKLASGFQPSALFNRCLELGVFDLIGEDALIPDEIAEAIGADARAVEIALNALTSLGLLLKVAGRYRNTPEGMRWLVKTSPEYRGSILRHIGSSWGDYSLMVETLKTGSAECARKEGQVPASDEELRDFILGMENMTREAAPLLAAKLQLESRKAILDIGAGPGNYCLAFAAAAQSARVTHFDLPATSAIARQFTAGKPGAERIEFLAGDFLVDPLGAGYDFIWLSQIIHMLSEIDAECLVAKAAEALAPGGVLAVHEHFLNDDMTSPLSAALFSVHMLTVTKEGRSYSFGEVERWMKRRGLESAGRVDYGAPSRITLGRKG